MSKLHTLGIKFTPHTSSDAIRLHHLFKYEHYRGDSVVKGKEERLFTNYVYILV